MEIDYEIFSMAIFPLPLIQINSNCYFRKYGHLLNTGKPLRRSKPAKDSVVSLTDRSDMTIAVYRGHNATRQQY